MRFLHTADWHLGRQLYGTRLLEDQAHLLDQLVAIAKETRPDAVVVAGDVYDRAVPVAEAVELLDDALSRIALDLGAPVLMIAGNHDGPERLQFGARLLAAGRLHVAGVFTAAPRCVPLDDAHGRVAFYLVPYVEPAKAREVTSNAELACHASVMAHTVTAIHGAHDRGCRSVLVGHAFVTGGMNCESERPLAVGGAEHVPAELLEGFHYVALGHLHRPQPFYSGSLMAYGFDEADHVKTVSLVELGSDGGASIERVPLTPTRRLRVLEGTLDDILRAAAEDPTREDYVMARLADTRPVLDAMTRLRAVYPYALHLERTGLDAGLRAVVPADRRRLRPEELFAAFFAETTGAELSDAQRAELARAIEAALAEDPARPVNSPEEAA